MKKIIATSLLTVNLLAIPFTTSVPVKAADTSLGMTGNLEPATIDFSVSPTNVDLSLAPGATSTSADITIQNNSTASVDLKLKGFKNNSSSWKPEFLSNHATPDWDTLSVAETNSKVAITFGTDSSNASWDTAPSYSGFTFPIAKDSSLASDVDYVSYGSGDLYETKSLASSELLGVLKPSGTVVMPVRLKAGKLRDAQKQLDVSLDLEVGLH